MPHTPVRFTDGADPLGQLAAFYLSEVVHELAEAPSAAALIATHGQLIAAMLRGERQPLSVQEEEGRSLARVPLRQRAARPRAGVDLHAAAAAEVVRRMDRQPRRAGGTAGAFAVHRRNELTDRTEHAQVRRRHLRGAAVRLIASRPGLETWKANVHEKLKTLDDVHRFAVERSSISRRQFLELTVVLILVPELALVFMSVVK